MKIGDKVRIIKSGHPSLLNRVGKIICKSEDTPFDYYIKNAKNDGLDWLVVFDYQIEGGMGSLHNHLILSGSKKTYEKDLMEWGLLVVCGDCDVCKQKFLCWTNK
jgi:hypothetical protein